MTLQVVVDFRDEVAELHAFLETLDPEDWETPTLFQDWTPWDVVAHLHFTDDLGLHAAAGRDAFRARRKALVESMGSGQSLGAIARLELGAIVRLQRQYAERQPLSDLIEEPDCGALIAPIVDLEDAYPGAVVDGSELVEALAGPWNLIRASRLPPIMGRLRRRSFSIVLRCRGRPFWRMSTVASTRSNT